MTIDEVLFLLNSQGRKNLLPVQEHILRQSWAGKTYACMAEGSPYKADYLRNVAAPTWHLLSDAFSEVVNKANFRRLVESLPFPADDLPSSHLASCCCTSIQTLEVPGGAMPLTSDFYIEHSSLKALAQAEIIKPGSVIRIKGSHKMGKSSLMLRITAQAAHQGYSVAVLDFHQAEEAIFSSLDRFLSWFCSNVSWQCNIEANLEPYWHQSIGSKISCTLYLQRYLLEKLDGPIVIALNEVDRIFKHPDIAQEFLPLLRSWHEEAKHVEIFQKLRLIVVHSTEVYIPLNINQSPFNVGLSIKLPPFTPSNIQDLANRHGLNWHEQQAHALMEMVGGHPYLVHLALYHLCSTDVSLTHLLETAPTLTGIYSDYLRGHWMVLQTYPKLADALKQVIHAETPITLDPILSYRLESMGLVKLEGDQAMVGCKLVRQYFTSQL